MSYTDTFKKFLKEGALGAETKNYMFFSNLKQIQRQCEILLNKDEAEISNLIENGHDWAEDHMSSATEVMDQVFDFIMNSLPENVNESSRINEIAYQEVKAKYANRPVIVHYISNDMSKWLVTFTDKNITVPYTDVAEKLKGLNGKDLTFPAGYRPMYEEDELDEISTSAGAGGYETPNAFGELSNDNIEMLGYKKVKKKDKSSVKESTFVRISSQLHL